LRELLGTVAAVGRTTAVAAAGRTIAARHTTQTPDTDPKNHQERRYDEVASGGGGRCGDNRVAGEYTVGGGVGAPESSVLRNGKTDAAGSTRTQTHLTASSTLDADAEDAEGVEEDKDNVVLMGSCMRVFLLPRPETSSQRSRSRSK
jgi:hypothetical protein